MMPAAYLPHNRKSPLTDPWEPPFARQTENAVFLELEIRPARCNARSFAHGGLISALADNAMGLSAVRQAREPPGSEQANAVTVSLTLDFVDVARAGSQSVTAGQFSPKQAFKAESPQWRNP